MPAVLFLKLLVIMALAGGVLTIVLSMWHITRRRKDRLKIPYGIAIAGAGLWIIATTDWLALHTLATS
jgi:prepilin peptidase CpaA